MSELPSPYPRLDIAPGSFLGLNYNGGHDSSIAIVAPDGRPTFACSLERFSRWKQDGRFPDQLLTLVNFERISACALPFYAPDAIPRGPSGQEFHAVLHGIAGYPLHELPDAFYRRLNEVPVAKQYVGHQIAHAAAAYYCSGFEEATILTYDAGQYNCPWFGGVFDAHGPSLRPIEYFPSRTNAKIASLYAVVTGLLGFTPRKHEGKVTGLAAFAEPKSVVVRIVCDLLTERYVEVEASARWSYAFHDTKPPQMGLDLERAARLKELFLGATQAEVAAALQYVTEEHVLDIARAIKGTAHTHNLCLSGGLFATVKLNQRLHELWDGDVFIAPPMGDDGTALGAALYAAFRSPNATFPLEPRPTMYLGPSFTSYRARDVLNKDGVEFAHVEAPAKTLARLLADGKVVAVFREAMEFGPRALGHRSILAPATRTDMNDWLNRKLHRTEFMPFAPITRIEDADLEYVGWRGAERSAEFMTVTFDVTDHLRKACPAVVHVDGTARPQLVRREVDPFLHELLTEYHALTGLTSLVNTSFNIHEEPIVCTPEEALSGFFQAQLDYLYLEGYLVSLQDNPSVSARYMAERGQTSAREAADRDVIAYLWEQNAMLQLEADRRLEIVNRLHQEGEEQRARELAPPPAPAVPDLPRVEEAVEAGEVTLASLARNVAQQAQAIERLTGLLKTYGVPIEGARAEPPALIAPRLRLLQLEKEAAEAAAEARLQVIERQKKYMEALRRWSPRAWAVALTMPGLGVLYQHPPRPLRIPPSYANVAPPPAAPKISVVTPSYNQAQFIERTMRSVLDQNYPELEYVVQDGGSSDGTVDLLEKYADSLHYFESKRDKGFANAINLGFARTSGEIMAYLNSDDQFLPGTIPYVAQYFERHPDVDVVYGHRIVVDEYDAEIGRWVLPPHDDEVLTWADYIPQETLFWRRELWERVGGTVDESFRFAVDWDLIMRFREAGARFARLPRFMGAFRVHPHQKTSAEILGVGQEEMGRIRARCHGRPVAVAEASQRVRPYLARHLMYDRLYRLGLVRY